MADTDLLTTDEATEAISMVGSGAQHAAQIALWVSAISERVDARCGPVVIREIEDETIFPQGGLLFPLYQPVVAISEITEYVSGVAGVLTAESVSASGDYLMRSGLIERRSGFSPILWRGPAVVTYTAGRFEDTESVGAKWKTAAGAALRRLWAREAPMWARGGGFLAGEETGGIGFFRVIDPVVDEWLADELNPPAVA